MRFLVSSPCVRGNERRFGRVCTGTSICSVLVETIRTISTTSEKKNLCHSTLRHDVFAGLSLPGTRKSDRRFACSFRNSYEFITIVCVCVWTHYGSSYAISSIAGETAAAATGFRRRSECTRRRRRARGERFSRAVRRSVFSLFLFSFRSLGLVYTYPAAAFHTSLPEYNNNNDDIYNRILYAYGLGNGPRLQRVRAAGVTSREIR